MDLTIASNDIHNFIKRHITDKHIGGSNHRTIEIIIGKKAKKYKLIPYSTTTKKYRGN